MNKTIHKIYIGLFFLLGIGVTVLILFRGYHYYSTPLEERFYNEAHDILKPSGFYGHGFGIIGTFMMLAGVVIYMIRKRVRKFSRIGILKHWLELHIFLCSVGPILILYHTAFKFGGIVSVSFWSMVAVVISGVIGRFIYVLIPRTIEGHEISLSDLESQSASLSVRLRDDFNLDQQLLIKIDSYIGEKFKRTNTMPETFKRIFTDRLNNKKIISEIKTSINDKESYKKISAMLKRKLYVTQRMSLLSSLHQIFRYWHIAHLPFALVMIIIMFIHVGVATAFGYTWIF